jgi:hypothetical protein
MSTFLPLERFSRISGIKKSPVRDMGLGAVELFVQEGISLFWLPVGQIPWEMMVLMGEFSNT